MTRVYRQIELPEDLCRAAEEWFVGDDFGSLEELVCFLLEEVTREDVLQMNSEEEQMIEKRLRGLGYL